MLLLVSDFAAGACFAGGALAAGVDVPPEECSPVLTGVVTAGVVAAGVTGAGVTIAGVTVLETTGATELGTRAASTVVLVAVVDLAGGAGVLTTMMSRTSIGGALFSASGIEAPAEATGTLGGSRSPAASLGRSARPIAKQQTNTTAHRSATTSSVSR